MREGLAGWWVRHPEQKQEAREGGESVVPFRSALTVSIVPALASSFLHLLQVPALSQPIGVHPPYLARSWRARRCIARRVFPTSPEFSCHSVHVPWEKEGLGVSWRHENHRSRLSCTEVDHVFGLAPRQKWKGKKKVSAAFDKKGSKNNHLACCWRRSAGQSDGRGFGHTSVSVSRLVRFLLYNNFPPKTRHVWWDRCREILPPRCWKMQTLPNSSPFEELTIDQLWIQVVPSVLWFAKPGPATFFAQQWNPLNLPPTKGETAVIRSQPPTSAAAPVLPLHPFTSPHLSRPWSIHSLFFLRLALESQPLAATVAGHSLFLDTPDLFVFLTVH